MKCAYCNETIKPGTKTWQGYSKRLVKVVVIHTACKKPFDDWEKLVQEIAAQSKGGKR